MVIWTLRARADLKAIHDYIAKDSRQNAKRFAHEIRRKADVLAEPPRVGRKSSTIRSCARSPPTPGASSTTCIRTTSLSSLSSTSAAIPVPQIWRRRTDSARQRRAIERRLAELTLAPITRAGRWDSILRACRRCAAKARRCFLGSRAIRSKSQLPGRPVCGRGVPLSYKELRNATSADFCSAVSCMLKRWS
jgi:hypothetical protein